MSSEILLNRTTLKLNLWQIHHTARLCHLLFEEISSQSCHCLGCLELRKYYTENPYHGHAASILRISLLLAFSLSHLSPFNTFLTTFALYTPNYICAGRTLISYNSQNVFQNSCSFLTPRKRCFGADEEHGEQYQHDNDAFGHLRRGHAFWEHQSPRHQRLGQERVAYLQSCEYDGPRRRHGAVAFLPKEPLYRASCVLKSVRTAQQRHA